MVYTSKKYQGLGVKHPWYNQQLKYLQIVDGETANKTPTRMLLQATVELLRWEIGLIGTFKNVPWEKLKMPLSRHGSLT